jgi:hypothetical protein
MLQRTAATESEILLFRSNRDRDMFRKKIVLNMRTSYRVRGLLVFYFVACHR